LLLQRNYYLDSALAIVELAIAEFVGLVILFGKLMPGVVTRVLLETLTLGTVAF
jgi:hypothetical protein